MKKPKIVLVLIGITLLLFVFLPVNKDDIAGLTSAEIECAKSLAYVTFDNPVERGLIKTIAITEKNQNIIIATSFTFVGLPLSAVAVDCLHGGATRL